VIDLENFMHFSGAGGILTDYLTDFVTNYDWMNDWMNEHASKNSRIHGDDMSFLIFGSKSLT